MDHELYRGIDEAALSNNGYGRHGYILFKLDNMIFDRVICTLEKSRIFSWLSKFHISMKIQ